MGQAPDQTTAFCIDGVTVELTVRLTSSGFRICFGALQSMQAASRQFCGLLTSRIQTWCNIQTAEHEEAVIAYAYPADRILIVEGTNWTPTEKDLRQLCLFLEGPKATVVTEDIETQVPPLRLHDLPASVRAAEPPEPLLALTG
jgi:hypothetical protein